MRYFCNNACWSSVVTVLALVIVSISGCARPTGSVSGTVSYKGKALPYGRVTLVCADGTVVSGTIHSDGTYTVHQAPAGLARVAVRCLEEAMPAVTMAEPGDPAGAPGAPMMMQSAEKPNLKPKAFRIPDHYQIAEKSGLTYEVHRGDQMYDIRLE